MAEVEAEAVVIDAVSKGGKVSDTEDDYRSHGGKA